MKKLIIMLTLGLFLTGNVYANVSCRDDQFGNTVCTDGTSARTDQFGNTTIKKGNKYTHCRDDQFGNTVCN